MRSAVCAFVVLFLLDVVYARYIIDTAAGHALAASLWAGAIQLLSGAMVLLVVNDWRAIPAAALGAFFGTYVAVVWG